MLFDAPAVGDAEESALGLIEDLRSRLRHYTFEPRRWMGVLRRGLFARAIRGSNSIEGYLVTLDDAVAAVDGYQPDEADAVTWAAVSCYRDAMTYVLQLSRDESFEYSEAQLKSLHYMMLKYDLDKSPGLYRPGQILVRDDQTGEIVYEGPDAGAVPALMNELAVELNSEPNHNALIRGAMAHLNLVMIHPFRDGNGRMARAVQTLVLARDRILDPRFSSIEEYLGANTLDYYEVLAEVGGGSWSPDRDPTRWIRFILTAHYRQGLTVLRRIRESERLWEELEILIERHGLPERTLGALWDGALGMRVKRASYMSYATEITEWTATADLKRLVEAELLEPKGERRGRYYLGSAQLRELRAKTREPRERPLPDPFGAGAA